MGKTCCKNLKSPGPQSLIFNSYSYQLSVKQKFSGRNFQGIVINQLKMKVKQSGTDEIDDETSIGESTRRHVEVSLAIRRVWRSKSSGQSTSIRIRVAQVKDRWKITRFLIRDRADYTNTSTRRRQ